MLELKVIFCTICEFDAGVNVFGVLAKNDHIHIFGMLDRRGNARKITHRALADIQVERLAQGHIKRTDAAADGRGQRAFNAHHELGEGLHRLIRKPGLKLPESFFPGVHFHPVDLAVSAVGFLDSRIKNAHRSAPDIAAGAVAFHEGQDRLIRYIKLAFLNGNLFPAGGDFHLGICHVCSPLEYSGLDYNK